MITRVEHGVDFSDRPQIYLTDEDCGNILVGLADADSQCELLSVCSKALFDEDVAVPRHILQKREANALRHCIEELGKQIFELKAGFEKLMDARQIKHDVARAA